MSGDETAAVAGGEAALIETANEPQSPEETNEAEEEEQQQKQQQQQQKPSSPSASDSVELPSPESFVNNGLARWLAAREAWCHKSNNPESSSSTRSSSSTTATETRKATPIDVDEVIDVLFDPRWRGGGRVKVSLVPPRFPTNVPLPQMIDVLTDLWEAEGLDV